MPLLSNSRVSLRIVKDMVSRSKSEECERDRYCIPGMRDADVTKEGKTIW